MNQPSSSTMEPKRLNFIEGDIPISKFMGKFQNHVYKYTKQSQRFGWKAYEFKQSHKVLFFGTIL